MTEHVANTYQTTLNNSGTLGSGDTSMVVTSATGAPAANFRVKIEAELILVTAVAGTTFTITRGIEGTSAASHADGSTVTHVLTSGSLAQLITEGAPGGGSDFDTYLAALSGLVHRWKFEEASGNFADSVGSLDLVPTGTVSYHNAGLVGAYAAGFAGGYAQSSGLGSIPVNAAARTFITIFRTNGVQTGRGALHSYGPTTTRSWWLHDINVTSAWTTELNTWNDDQLGESAGVGDGNWHFVATGHDGDRMTYTYVDGRIQYHNLAGALTTAWNGGDFYVAQTSNPGSFDFHLLGYIDDLSVFSTFLNKSQLDQLFLRMGGAL